MLPWHFLLKLMGIVMKIRLQSGGKTKEYIFGFKFIQKDSCKRCSIFILNINKSKFTANLKEGAFIAYKKNFLHIQVHMYITNLKSSEIEVKKCLKNFFYLKKLYHDKLKIITSNIAKWGNKYTRIFILSSKNSVSACLAFLRLQYWDILNVSEDVSIPVWEVYIPELSLKICMGKSISYVKCCYVNFVIL